MGLSGRVGAGVLDELEQIVAQQLIQQRMKMQEEGEAFDRQMRERQMSGLEQERNDAAGFRQRQEARQTAADRAAGERAAHESTARSNMSELLNDPTQLAAFSMASGVDVPAGVREAIKPPPPPKMRSVTVRGPKGQPINRMVPETEAVEEYREPRAPASVSRTWVMRDGKPVRVSENDIRPGDAPFDAVAARQDKGTPGASPYASERADRTVQAVDELIGQVGLMTAGLGSLQAMVPGTPARDFAASLDTLKANIAFNELAQMRETSKTGGALGAVSERELQLLESTLGALDAGQSPGKLREQLAKVKESVQRWQEAQGATAPPPSSGAGGGMPALRFNPATGKLEPIGQ